MVRLRVCTFNRSLTVVHMEVTALQVRFIQGHFKRLLTMYLATSLKEYERSQTNLRVVPSEDTGRLNLGSASKFKSIKLLKNSNSIRLMFDAITSSSRIQQQRTICESEVWG